MDDISASKNCNSDANSDSSEDLPVISPQSFDIGNLQKNDIVWAEYKHLHWPAVVRNVDKKNRKVSVLYCDSPLKTFKIPFRKIHSFNDMEFNKKVKDQEMSPQIYNKHLKVMSMAAAFSHRRALGKCDDPVSFFDTSKPYFACQNTDFASMDEIGSHSIQESENEGNNISSVQSGSKLSKLENDKSCSVEIINSGISEKFEDSESAKSSDRENPVPTNSRNLLRDDCRYDCDENTANAIVSCIKSGCLDEYLLDIHRGKIKSKNHDIFNQAKEIRNKDVLWDFSSTIGIATEKLKDVAHYLKDLYDRRVKKKKGFMFDEIDYIVTVWTYDAIDKALSLIQSEPSKYFIDSNSANCSSPSNEHSSFTKDHDNLNSKRANSDVNSDSSKDLPVISPQSFDIGNLQKNDIVWAGYNHLYWPAVVRHVDKKNRKVSIFYCDSPLKTFKIPFQKIHSFNDMEFKKKVHDQEMSTQTYYQLLKVMSMAAAFVQLRAMGECDDPVSFFDTSKAYIAIQNKDFISIEEIGSHSIQETENEGNNISSVQSGSKISKLENDESCSVEIINSEILEKSEDSDSTESSDRENPVCTNSHDLLLDDCSDDCDENTANAIVSCIKSGCLDEYLLDILRGKIKSKNHDIFNQAKEARNKDVLWDCSSTIGIATEKMKDVARYLQDLYDRRVKKKKEDFMWGEIDYIVTVWTYDAIDKALSLIQSEPSKYVIDSNSANCSSPSNEHSSFTKDHDNLNSKSAKRKSSDSNEDEPKGKEVCGKSCQKKTNAKKTTEGRKNLKNIRKRNYVPTSMSLRSSKALGKTNSDVSTECEKILTLKPRTFFQMGTIHFNFPSKVWCSREKICKQSKSDPLQNKNFL